MNKHISLVKKSLNDPDSVSQKELRHNADESLDTARAAWTAADAASAAASAAWTAADAAAAAASAAASAAFDPADAAYWVEEYEELINE